MKNLSSSSRSDTIALAAALAGGLAIGGAIAADQGPRHHAEGAYEAAIAHYVVVAGDDLAAIAERFGVSVTELKNQNKLASDTIEAGQTLVIPGGPAGPAYKMTTPMPPGVAAPDKVETRLGTLTSSMASRTRHPPRSSTTTWTSSAPYRPTCSPSPP
ncbi:MAG: LysM peptidoglycan-binding domain-containing protein [Candidatus Competibacteraceae bacterium]|nr:LysM peptidoglycan-binding domain-containing protein [Candidatus Competibacteraceae bacterium]